MRPTLAPPPPTTTRPPTTAPSTSTLPDLDRSPLGRYLLHPQRTLAAAARTLAHHAAPRAHRYGLWLLMLAVILLAARVALARWRAARLHDGARLVEVLPPPQVDPDGAPGLWRNLAGLLRQRRLLQGRPHVALEYRWSPAGLTIALWLPGMVAPRLVERAVEAAWPGARTHTTTPAPPPLPVGERVGGGALRLAQPEWYALRAEHPTDPLRALLGAAEELGAGESAIVQVLARTRSPPPSPPTPAATAWPAATTPAGVAPARSASGGSAGGCCSAWTSWPPWRTCPGTAASPAWSAPGPARSRHPQAHPERARSSATPTPALRDPSPWTRRMRVSTPTCWARPARASPPCWATSSCRTSTPAAAWSWSTRPRATWSASCWTGCPAAPATGWCCWTPTSASPHLPSTSWTAPTPS